MVTSSCRDLTRSTNDIHPSSLGARCPNIEMLNHLLIQPLFVEHQGDLVNAIHILSGNDLFRSDIAEQGNLLLDLASDFLFGSAYEDVRLDTYFPEGLHAVLCGFCLHFARGFNIRKQGKMDIEHVSEAPGRPVTGVWPQGREGFRYLRQCLPPRQWPHRPHFPGSESCP